MQTPQTPGDTSWFTHDRFGMFIHWGIYTLPARHEWVKSREMIPDDVYQQYFRHFEPDLYDPALWADAAGDAGMKYFVATSKHHDGFCLWDSQLTDYKATNTPAGRDLLKPMVQAFRQRGLRAGFYHSLLDWHHQQYLVDPYNHPMREYEDRQKLNVGRDQMKYADYLHGQVRELLTELGDIDVLWFDYSFAQDQPEGKGKAAWRSEELYEMIRELRPRIILNDRLDLERGWDIKTPEQYQPRQGVRVAGRPVVWEACQTFSGAWGYHRDEQTWRSTDELIRTLIDCVSKDGNLLLNVGPTGRGEFDQRALERLGGIGRWMFRHSRSIYGCTQAPDQFETPRDCRLTYHPGKQRLYVHVLAWPYKHLHLDGQAFVDRVEYAQFLSDASQVQVKGGEAAHGNMRTDFDPSQTLTLELPIQRPDVAVPVIELFLK